VLIVRNKGREEGKEKKDDGALLELLCLFFRKTREVSSRKRSEKITPIKVS
jgi:hypothetical protein